MNGQQRQVTVDELMQIITNGLEAGAAKGAFNLAESANVFQALNLLKGVVAEYSDIKVKQEKEVAMKRDGNGEGKVADIKGKKKKQEPVEPVKGSE